MDKYEVILSTLQQVCKLNDENEKLKREIDTYKKLFLKDIDNLGGKIEL